MLLYITGLRKPGTFRPRGPSNQRNQSVEDRQLIAECLRGRTEAFGELVRRYQDRLYDAALAIVEASSSFRIIRRLPFAA